MDKSIVKVLFSLMVTISFIACGNSNPTSSTYLISGTVTSSGRGLQSVTVTLNGPDTVMSDSDGNYSFSGLSNGNYTITPSKSGYAFNPVSSTLTVNGSNITGVNFTATAAETETYSISGMITFSGMGLQGVTVTLNGADTLMTDSDGNFLFSGLSNGNHTITPDKSGYAFYPVSSTQTINGSNVTGLNFTGTAAETETYSISGTITSSGNGLKDVTVTLNGSEMVTTNSKGNFSFSGLSNGSYTITPSKSDYVFNPISNTQTVTNSSITGVNFTSVNLASFKEMAQETFCSDIVNRLFLIDGQIVFWHRQGHCPDNAYSFYLYADSVATVLCYEQDSISGSNSSCMNDSYQGMFDTIIVNLDKPDLGLGSGYTVSEIIF